MSQRWRRRPSRMWQAQMSAAASNMRNGEDHVRHCAAQGGCGACGQAVRACSGVQRCFRGTVERGVRRRRAGQAHQVATHACLGLCDPVHSVHRGPYQGRHQRADNRSDLGHNRDARRSRLCSCRCVANLCCCVVQWGLAQGGGSDRVDFKGCNFNGAVLLWAARWCCRCEMSYRDLEPA